MLGTFRARAFMAGRAGVDEKSHRDESLQWEVKRGISAWSKAK